MIERRACSPHLESSLAVEPYGAFVVCSAFDDLNNKQQLRGPAPKPLKDIMQTITQKTPVKMLLQPLPKKQSRKSATPWQPLSSGLTREEIRAIIIDQIG